MNKLNSFLFILAIAFLSSCKLNSFTAQPGVSVKEIPAELHGSFRHIEKHKGVRDTQILIIDNKGAQMKDPIVGMVFNLADTNYSFSHLGDFYYVNLKETDSIGTTVWFVYPFEYTKNHLFVYKLILSKKNMRRMERCGLKPKGVNGLFEMDNEAFKKYCERYLKKKHAIKFERIK